MPFISPCRVLSPSGGAIGDLLDGVTIIIDNGTTANVIIDNGTTDTIIIDNGSEN